VIILFDDLGYGDLGCYGASDIRTPRLDRMAREGMRFTNFHAQTVCGPSRAALMTGCYPLRVATDHNKVDIMPHLHLSEVTVAEVLKSAGYATEAIGKWDLAGHSQADYSPELLPTHQGFDQFFGTPSSNDAVINLIRDDKLVERHTDMSTITRRYTDEAIAFVKHNKAHPFFLYLAHNMPHMKLAASPDFKGKSSRGLYGDVVEELDWNTGRLLDALQAEGLAANTIVIALSDNGPWYINRPIAGPKPGVPQPGPEPSLTTYPFNQRDERGSHGGSAGPLRGHKTSAWEGGLRVPCIVWSPGRVPAGALCAEMATTLDLLPTFARMGGGAVPSDRVIDGHDITPLLTGVPGAKSPTKAFFYYQRTRLCAVEAGKWKLQLPRPADKLWYIYSKPEDCFEIKKPMLFDLTAHLDESADVAAQHPDVVKQMLKLAEGARADIGDFDRVGAGARFFDSDPKRPDISGAEIHM
jgi:arylsulfatase A-like enzyme